MSRDRVNLAASVCARLYNRAKQTGDDFQTLLTGYCFERFLYRLGRSELRDRFVLKGAMLLRVWSEQPYRATRDLDLLRRGDGSFAAIRDDLHAVLATAVEPDGLVFDVAGMRLEALRAEDEYAGTRATLLARCGTARLSLQIDMGLGDAVWPQPEACVYPALLDLPAPTVLAYPRDAVVAEKLEALVVLGDRNSRIKDFFDLYHLACHFEFERGRLAESIEQTFARRGTPVTSGAPIGLTREYWENPSRPAQVAAFARRARLTVPAGFADAFTRILGAFLLPVLDDLQQGERRVATWQPGGPWR